MQPSPKDPLGKPFDPGLMVVGFWELVGGSISGFKSWLDSVRPVWCIRIPWFYQKKGGFVSTVCLNPSPEDPVLVLNVLCKPGSGPNFTGPKMALLDLGHGMERLTPKV